MNAETKPRRRGANSPLTVADIAAHADAIAAFAYAVGHDGSHTEVRRAGAPGLANTWAKIAMLIAGIGGEATIGDRVRVIIGDAQAAVYLRQGRHAVVAIIVAGSDFTKSVLRMCRDVLRTLAAADEVENAQNKAIAAAAVARDLGAIR